MDQPAAHCHRRQAAAAASSSPLPSPPPPPLHHRLPLPDDPPPPRSLPLPSALLPPKKRRVLSPPCKASTPLPPPPPPPPQTYAPATPVPSTETLALLAPSPLPPVADSGLLPPPPPLVSEEDAAPSARPITVADPKQPSTPPPAPDASAKPAPTRKVRKVVRKVIVKKFVPKGTFAARKAAAAAAAAVSSDGAAKLTGQSTGDKPANDHNVATDDPVPVGKEQSGIVLHRPVKNCNAFAAPAEGASESGVETPNDKPKNDQHATTDDSSVDKEQDADETVVEKLATDCDAVAVQAAAGSEAPIDKLTNHDQDIPAAKSVGKEQDANETIDVKPATNCNAAAMTEASSKETPVESWTEQTLARKPAIDCNARVGEEVGMSERQRTSMMEVFVGGLDRDAKEEDVRAVFRKAGEITQVRMIMDAHTRKNKGYCFVRYREAAQAKDAIAKFGKVKICGKFCRTAAPVGNDSISPGNINKKQKKEHVKSIFVEGVPSSWGQAKLTQIFKNYGKIEHIFLSRNVRPSKNRGCACIKYMAHEAAMLCLESFYKEELTENGSKVNIKVSMANSVQKSKQNKDHTFSFNENDKAVGDTFQTTGNKKSSTNHDMLHYPRKRANWRHRHTVPAHIQDHRVTYSGRKRPCPTLDDCSSDLMRSHSRPRNGSSTSTTSTLRYNVMPPSTTRSPLPSSHDNSSPEGLASYYGGRRSSISSQIRQVEAHQLVHPYGSIQGWHI